MGLDTPSLEATGTELLGEIVQHLDIMRDSGRVVLGDNRDVTERLPLNHCLSIRIGKFRCRPDQTGLNILAVHSTEDRVRLT